MYTSLSDLPGRSRDPFRPLAAWLCRGEEKKEGRGPAPGPEGCEWVARPRRTKGGARRGREQNANCRDLQCPGLGLRALEAGAPD